MVERCSSAVQHNTTRSLLHTEDRHEFDVVSDVLEDEVYVVAQGTRGLLNQRIPGGRRCRTGWAAVIAQCSRRRHEWCTGDHDCRHGRVRDV